MSPTERFLIQAAIVFAAACLFFSIQPWMDAVTGWYRWYVMAMRAGEVLALYALGYGLIIWAGVDALRWRWITTGGLWIGAALLVHAIATFMSISSDMDTQWLPKHATDWTKRPYIGRIGIACSILLIAGLGRYSRSKRIALVITLIALSLYRLAPELNLLFNPLDGAFGLMDVETGVHASLPHSQLHSTHCVIFLNGLSNFQQARFPLAGVRKGLGAFNTVHIFSMETIWRTFVPGSLL